MKYQEEIEKLIKQSQKYEEERDRKWNNMAKVFGVDVNDKHDIQNFRQSDQWDEYWKKDFETAYSEYSALQVTVKKYMTKPSTPEFDFMSKWNHDNPMPLCTMIGTKEKETKGMVYMKLHADTTFKKVMCCMKCGRPITNPVSQYFGMGPECGRHNYVNPFDTEEELQEAVKQYKQNVLGKIEWEGWVIRSSILEEEIINE